VTVQIAKEENIIAIHAFMIHNAIVEMAEADVDTVIYMQTIYDTVMQGAGLFAVMDKRIVGYLGLWKSQYDYSKDSFLHDRGFYVLPTHRDGSVAAALLQEARAIANDTDLALKIIDTNPTKVRRARSRMAVTAEIVGYRPAGRVITVYPSEAA
jgi:GNAT superfamily N-acetyltransferase